MSSHVLCCEACGGILQYSQDRKSAKCPYCGNQYFFAEEKSEALIMALNRANAIRLKCDFDEAITEYQLLVDRNPEDAEAHWGLAISTYGIEYVEDPRTRRHVPTCRRTLKDNFTLNEHYKKAIEYASPEQRERYRINANAIERLQKNIRRKLEEEEDYDVFISFKSTDENGAPTRDRQIARTIYDELTKRNIRTFFSEVTLRDRLGEEFEPIIFKALYSCRFFILIATDQNNIESPWVKNEWSRFRDRVFDEGLTNACCAVFENLYSYDLPPFLRAQGIDLSKYPVGGYEILIADSLSLKLNIGKNKSNEHEQNNKVIVRSIVDSTPSKPIKKKESIIFDIKDSKLIKANGARGKIIIPEHITSIEDGAFCYCKELTCVEIPAGVKRIGQRAFSGCSGLTSIKISEGVEEIGSDAFSGCSGLNEITIPNSVTSIEEAILRGCDNLERIKFPMQPIKQGAIKQGKYFKFHFGWLFGTPSYGTENFYVPEKLKNVSVTGGTLPFECFKNCEFIVNLEIGDVKMSSYFCDGCFGLRKLDIPFMTPLVSSIGTMYDEKFYLPNDMVLIIRGGNIYEDAFQHYNGGTNIILGNNVKDIGDKAFLGYRDMKSIKLGTGLRRIGADAFWGCNGLTEIEIPSSVCFIGKFAFGGGYAAESNKVGGRYDYGGGYIVRGEPETYKIIVPNERIYKMVVGSVDFFNKKKIKQRIEKKY